MKKNQSSKRKLPNTWKKKDTILAILACISLLIFIIHYSCLYVNAASVSNGEFPYVVPQYRQANSFIPDGALTKAIAYYSDISRNYLHYSGTLDYIVFTTDGVVNGYYEFMFICNPTIDTNITSNYNFLNSSISVRSNNIQIVWVKVKTDNFNTYSYNVNKGWTASLLGSSSTQSQFGGFFTPRYPFYMSDDYEVTKNDILVFTNTSPIAPNPVVNGQATEPDNDTNNNITDDGTAAQPNTPTFPIFIAPQIDTSSLENLVQSLIDYVHEFADYVGECFSTFFSWLVAVIKNGLQSIINEIRDFKDFIYDNFVSLFEAISSNIEYLIEPVQSEVILETFENTEAFSDYSSMTDLVNDSFDIFDSISEPSTFKIPIHLENVTMLNCNTQYIDLGWFDSCKTALRAFMWCITTFGLLYTIIDALPSYISGGDE